MMKHLTKKIKIISCIAYVIVSTYSCFALYDPTLIGYGTHIPYLGYNNDIMLDSANFPNEGQTVSPYSIVLTGASLLNLSSTLLSYPVAASSSPSITRFNRSGTADTNFGYYTPGTGAYTKDGSTNTNFSSLGTVGGQNAKLLAGSDAYYFVYVGGSSSQSNFTIEKYLPLSGRMDLSFGGAGTGIQTLTIQDNTGASVSATISSACIDTTTNKIYIAYNNATDTTKSYIAALTISNNSFAYDTGFGAGNHGVALLTVSTVSGTATSIKFGGINYDDNNNVVVVAGSLVDTPTKLLIARYTTTGSLDTTFNATGYKTFVSDGTVTGGTSFNPTIVSQFILSKYKLIASTQYYYLCGYDSTGGALDVMWLNVSSAILVPEPGVVTSPPYVGTVSTISSRTLKYNIIDVCQVPSYDESKAIGVAIGVDNGGTYTYAGIVDFELENVSLDMGGHSVQIQDVNAATALGTGFSGDTLFFYTCMYDSTLFVPSSLSANPQAGIVLGANYSSTHGSFINFTYDSASTHSMIPVTGIRLGLALLDYTNTTNYPRGFTLFQSFYSAASGKPSYYISTSGGKNAGNDIGLMRFDLTNNSFDMNFGGSGNPFLVFNTNTVLQNSDINASTGIVYVLGVENNGSGSLVVNAFDTSTNALQTAFTRTGHTDNGTIAYSSFGTLSSFSQLDVAVQTINSKNYLAVVGTSASAQTQGFVVHLNALPVSNSLDGILDDGFGLYQSGSSGPRTGYNIFNVAGGNDGYTGFSACAVDSVGNIIAAGASSGSAATNAKLLVARFTPTTGQYDTTFGPGTTQPGYGYFTLLGLSGTGYTTNVNSVNMDPNDNIYVVGRYRAPLVPVPGTNPPAGTPTCEAAFVSKFIPLGIQDQTFNNQYGTFIIPVQYPSGTGRFTRCIYDPSSLSNLSSPTYYTAGYVGTQTNSYAIFVRFSVNQQSLSQGQSLTSGKSGAVSNVNGNLCPNLVVPPIYVTGQQTVGGLVGYLFNNMKSSQDVQNALNISGIVQNLTSSLQTAGADATSAASMAATFQSIIVQLINSFATTYASSLLPHILYLSQSIAANECLLTANITNTSYLQAIYVAESQVQANIKIAGSYCTSSLVSPYI